VNDDFRVLVRLGSASAAAALVEELQRGGLLEHGLASGAGDRVIVSQDGSEVFLYTDTEEQARRALAVVQQLGGGGAPGDRRVEAFSLRRWHPIAEEWEDLDVPLPRTPEEQAAERAEVVSRERAETESLGVPEYEVRVQCGSHRDCVALADRLTAEGLSPLRRWRFLLIGAADEESARALADRLLGEVPTGGTVTVEASAAAVAAGTPANPFAVFGGLGG
jgi:hypothetical protein